MVRLRQDLGVFELARSKEIGRDLIHWIGRGRCWTATKWQWRARARQAPSSRAGGPPRRRAQRLPRPPVPIILKTGDTFADRVARAIRLAPGFPRPGIRIRDISPIAEGDPRLFAAVVDAMAGFFRADPPDTVMCMEAWGFIFNAPIC